MPKRKQAKKVVKSKSKKTKTKTSSSSSPTFKWLLKHSTMPSNCGCYAGSNMSSEDREQLTSETVLSEHDTESEAIQAAKNARDRDEQFDDWAEDYYDKDDEPPYNSAHGQNYDEDDWTLIFIVSPDYQAQQLAKKNAANARATNSKAKPRKKHIVTFGLVKGANTAFDSGLFFRNPSSLSCAEMLPSSSYMGTGKSSMLYMMQRNSERNYLLYSFCLEGASISGASFTKYKRKHIMSACLCWNTPVTLDNMVDECGEGGTIVDTCHANLFKCNHAARRTDILLTADALISACNPSTTTIFLNCFNGVGSGFECAGWTKDAVKNAIDQTKGNLKVFSNVEGEISLETLAALEKCNDLRGILLAQCKNASDKKQVVTDSAMASLLRASPNLKFLWISEPLFFGDSCWSALAEGCCPALEFLWIDQSQGRTSEGYWIGRTFAEPNIVRSALRPGTSLANTLKFCMINPIASTAKSRYILGGKGKTADKLDGKKYVPPTYDY